jgi:hypothetical protein
MDASSEPLSQQKIDQTVHFFDLTSKPAYGWRQIF